MSTAPILWLALVVSFSSLALSIYVSVLSRATSRAETFRQMRFAFFEFRQKLPYGWWNLQKLPERPEELQAMVRYWQYAFDEWFITNELNPYILKPLWTRYYERAIAASANRGPMLAALFEAFRACDTPTDRKFLTVILSMSTDEAKQSAIKIAGASNIPIPQDVGLKHS